MAYIDKHYYTFSYYGKAIPPSEFYRLADRSSEIIDLLTYGKAATAESKRSQEAVKKATAAQMEYLYSQGDYDSYTGDPENNIKSEEIGNYKYLKNVDSNQKSLWGIPISPLALSYLDSVGLRNSLV